MVSSWFPFCPYPRCSYLNNTSEDDLQNHYSCHFGPTPSAAGVLNSGAFQAEFAPLEPRSAAEGISASPTDPGERLVDNPPDAELLRIEHIIRDREKGPSDYYKALVIDASLSLIRKFCQAGRDGLSTNAGDLLLTPRHSTEDQRRLAKASVRHIHFTHQGVQFSIDYHHQRPSPLKCLELRLEDGATAAAPGDSHWAWILFVTDLQSSSCTCLCCVMKDIRPAVDSGLLRYNPSGNIQVSYFASGLYRCDSHGCSHKSKRWADLQRHVLSRHCSKPASYPCAFPGCERGGGNGFPRKDKLKSHFENVHRGRGIPPRQPRALAPK